MKKLLLILILLVGCSFKQATYTSTVLVSNENQLLLFDDNELVSLPANLDFEAGDQIVITYDGAMMETYPAQPVDVTKLENKGKNETILNFILRYLETHPTISQEIEVLGIDPIYALDIKGLTQPQINALSYVLGFEKEIILATYEELSDQGEIIDMVFNDGLLFQIYIDDLNFEINIYKSGLAAIWTKGFLDYSDGIYQETITFKSIS
ncbi:MAG TPA: hypothetical protein GX703_00625 [Erysipelothrix sp.]|jgi:hypothetical protein|nr:hypothetical protein [Erysipelothrix sp.]